MGAIGTLTQFAIIHEAHGIISELSKLTNLGSIAESFAKSGCDLSLTMTFMPLFRVGPIGSFAFVVL